MRLSWEIQIHWPTTKHWKLHIVWKYVLLRLFTFESAILSPGGDVIIVIGGDNKYKGEDEEERAVISRWAKRKVISQFGEEYLDGRKSFIFSWNKQHRAVHEQALLHHFDPNKKGQKFKYRPPTPNQQSNSEPQLQETSTELENPFTSKSYSQNDKDPSLLTADKEENPPDLHPSGVSSAAGGSRDLAEMEEPDINADSSSNYLHNITADHLQTKYSELKSGHGESTQSTPQPVLATQLPGNPSPVVVLRSIACYGKISNQFGDLQVWDPEFKIPEDI